MSELATSQDLSANLFLSYLKKSLISIILSRKSFSEAPVTDATHNLIVNNSNSLLEKYITDFVGPLNINFDINTKIYLNIFTVQGYPSTKTLIEVWCFTLSQADTNSLLEFFKPAELAVYLREIVTVTRVLPAYEYSKHLRRTPNSYSLEFELTTEQTSAFGNVHTNYSFPPLNTRIGSLEIMVTYRTNLVSLSETGLIDIDMEESYRKPDKIVVKPVISIMKTDDIYGNLKSSGPIPPVQKPEPISITEASVPVSSVPQPTVPEPNSPVQSPDLSKLTIKEVSNSSSVDDIELPPPVSMSPLEALFIREIPELKQFQFDDSHLYMTRLNDHITFFKNISV